VDGRDEMLRDIGDTGDIGPTENTGHNWVRRAAADFALALALFWAVAFFVNGDHNRAHAVTAPRIGKETILNAAIAKPASWPANWPAAMTARSKAADFDHQQALNILSVAFAAIVALNLAFWRHLRRVYASPRRSVWRRGK
jgi:hypothetical protein